MPLAQLIKGRIVESELIENALILSSSLLTQSLTLGRWLIEFPIGSRERGMANWITLSRLPLLLVFILMLYFGDSTVRVISVPLLFIALMFDSVDGTVARRTDSASLLGSVLDIAADRVYELILWVSFVDLKLIPVAIPLIVIARTTMTDALRSLGVRDGKAPFEQHETKLGTFIVGSRFMRMSYGFAKVIAFCGLTLSFAFTGYPQASRIQELSRPMLSIFQIISWIAVALCVIRGLPVILGTIIKKPPKLRRE